MHALMAIAPVLSPALPCHYWHVWVDFMSAVAATAYACQCHRHQCQLTQLGLGTGNPSGLVQAPASWRFAVLLTSRDAKMKAVGIGVQLAVVQPGSWGIVLHRY